MDIGQYLRILRAHWIMIVLLAAAGAAASGLYGARPQPQMYRAQSQVFVSLDSSDADLGQVGQGPSFAVQRLRSYIPMIDSPAVLDEVIRRLKLPYTADQLAAGVQGSTPTDSLILYVNVNDSSAQRSLDIANVTATVLVEYIETIETRDGESSSPIRATIVAHAVEAIPVTPDGSKLTFVLGAFLGLALGIGIAIARRTLDRTIRGRPEVAAVTDLPIIGELADDAETRKRPLIVDTPTGARSEGFRRLRTNVRSLSGEHRARSLVVTSAVRGEGTSTIAANLAIALAKADEMVLLIDGNLRNPCLATLFSLPDRVGLSDVLRGDVEADAAMQRWRPELPLFVMTAGQLPPSPGDMLGSRRLSQVIASLAATNMTMVIDSPPLVPVTDAADLALATEGVLIVTRMGSTKADELTAAIEALATVDVSVLGIVANRAPRTSRSSSVGTRRSTAAQHRTNGRTARPRAADPAGTADHADRVATPSIPAPTRPSATAGPTETGHEHAQQ